MPKKLQQSVVSRESTARNLLRIIAAVEKFAALGMEETIEDLDESEIEGTDPANLVIMDRKDKMGFPNKML